MSMHDLNFFKDFHSVSSLTESIRPKIFELTKDKIQESFKDTDVMEHKMELIAEINWVRFVNDSRAYNINTTWYALEVIDAPIVWIAGGVDNKNDWNELHDLIKEKVIHVLIIGEDHANLKSFLKNSFGTRIYTIIDEINTIAQVAFKIATDKSTVLFSPACASFDQFHDFEDRGHYFQNLVKKI